MNTIQKFALAILLLLLCLKGTAEDRYKTFTITHRINAPIDQVWAVIGEDFGNVAKAHHGFVSSSFTDGSSRSGEGAMRICYLNEEGTRYLRERQINFDPLHYSFTAEVVEGKGLPLATGTNLATYTLTPLDDQSCTLTISVKMRSDPPVFSALFSRKYEQWMLNYAIGLHHYVLTGEMINENNFDQIQSQYQ